MLTRFLLKCRIDIEATIDVPPTGFFVHHPMGARICYKIAGKNRWIRLSTPEKFFSFLLKHRIIDKVEDGKMWRKSLLTTTGANGAPVFHERFFEVKKEDIVLSAAQVQSFAAVREMGRNRFLWDFIDTVFKLAS
jgi:hypothetical protein